MIKKFVSKLLFILGYQISKKCERKKFIDNLYPVLIKKKNQLYLMLGQPR
tara:strand:+ start:2056 stop:2205 length:150 start_codon:yes stop_codon:yes gene_type:complete